MAASAAALKKIADAADPLYKTLDDGQKRRLAMLTHQGDGRFGGGGWRRRFEHGMMGGDRDRDDGPGRITAADGSGGFDRAGLTLRRNRTESRRNPAAFPPSDRR